ncbi:MAG: lipopolysaccharide kinase InaA family protein [Sedimentisphaerales bacterium]|jgi:heptose I phosphotransferase
MSEFIEITPDFSVRRDFVDCFKRLGLDSIEKIFLFEKGKDLAKANLHASRRRIMFETDSPKTTLFLKRYQNVPKFTQLKNWLTRRKKISTMACDLEPAENLRKLGINTPQTIAFGCQWQGLFEKHSFIITEKIPDSFSLEVKLPKKNRKFIENLASFVRKFHNTGFRHRDLYLCHIFSDSRGQFTLIDLSRVFKPLVFSKKFLVKDLAQLYYSAPGDFFTKTDRLKFLLCYLQKDKLTKQDKILIKNIKLKAKQMARHDKKHGRIAPFER